jgi:uncharacterized membrane protein
MTSGVPFAGTARQLARRRLYHSLPLTLERRSGVLARVVRAQGSATCGDAWSSKELPASLWRDSMGDDYKFRYGKTLAGPAERPAPAGTGGRTTDPSGGSAAPVESRVKFLGHAVHQQLIPFPFGLLATAVIFDVLHLILDNGELANVAYWMIVAGVVGGLVAAPFGLIDWTGIPKGTRAKKVGAVHGLGNLVVVVLFVVSWWLRREDPTAPQALALAMSFAGFALAGVTGWLGGELVDRHAVGIDHGAHPDSPHSLSGRPASDDGPALAR